MNYKLPWKKAKMHQTHYSKPKSKSNFSIKSEQIETRKRGVNDFRIGKIIGKGIFMKRRF